ncbi:MAG: hypothetical protein R3E39_22695 [Anaerolineae bacterium]
MSESAPTSAGCFSFVLMLFAALFTSFFVAQSSSIPPPVESPAVVVTAVSTPLLEAVYWPVQTDFTVDQLQAAAAIMEKRLAALGVNPSSVEVVDGTIVVKMPQTDNAGDIYNPLGNRGLVELIDFSGIDPNDDSQGFTWVHSYIATSAEIQLPFDEPVQNPLTNKPFVTVVSGSDIITASAEPDQFSGWQVLVKFTDSGSAILKTFTRSHIGQPMAIVVDSVIIAVPIINTELGSEIIIQSNYTEAEARQLATQIGIGALPIDLELTSVYLPG